MSFDLSSLDTRAIADAGIWKTLVDLNGNEVIADDKKPVQFHLVGHDSAVAKEAFQSLQGKTGEALDAAAKSALAKCIKGWTDNLVSGGEPFAFSSENALTILEIPHIAEWVMAEITARANFTKKG